MAKAKSARIGAAKSGKVKHVIICDDIRHEHNGKEFLIGVYNDIIIVGGFPAFMNQLFFRIAVDHNAELLGECNLSLLDPNGEKTLEVSTPISRVPSGDNHIIGMGFRGLLFKTSGTYVLNFGINQPPQRIWDFSVRLPSNEKEMQRLDVASDRNT